MSKRYTLRRSGYGPDGDTRTTPRKSNILNGNSQTGQDSQTPHELAESNSQADSTVAQLLTELLAHDEGWLRAVPDVHGKTLFLKWKWSKGKYQGKYVMSVVPPWQLELGLEILLGKVDDVEAGTRKPVVDTPWRE